MKISVFGIGYVGAVTSACLVKSGHEVIAVDVDKVKVDCINEGRSPIVEDQLEELIEGGVKSGMLSATQDIAQAVQDTEISLICVGTPSNEDGSLNLEYVEKVCEQIGEAIREKDEYHVVVLRSTCLPGTARDLAIPAVERGSGKKAGVDFGFGNNPEFLREGSAVNDYYAPPKIVIGADEDKTAQMIAALYAEIDAPEVVTDVATAEGVKYADNCWHAMKVGFANELGNILSELGLDSHKVMDIFFLDTKLNISKAYLLPGFAFGGSCLPKDVRAIRASGNANGVQTPIFDGLLEGNEEQIRRAQRMIEQTGARKIGMMGLAFKAGTDDLRESPLVKLADSLLEEGYELKIYDPAVYRAKNMNGANSQYIREGIPHISSCMVATAEEMQHSADLYIIGNHGEDYSDILSGVNDNVPIIDLVRVKKSPLTGRSMYKGICW